jgi:outer membrane protein TolC
MKRLSFFLAVLILFFPVIVAAEEIIHKGEVLTLEQCVDIALRQQPSILAARGNVDVYYARKGQAESGYYPQIDASLGYTRFQPSTVSTGTTTVGISGRVASTHSFWQYSTDITATQTIFDFWKTKTQVNIAKLNIDSSKEDLKNTEEQVILNVKQAYYAVLEAQRNLEVAGETVKQFQQHLEQAKAFYEVGTKPKFDVTNAEVDLGNARLALIRAENSLKVAKVTLSNRLGLPEPSEYEIEDNLSFVKYSIGLQEAIDRAYENRPELKSIAFKKKAGEESVSLAKKGYLPVLAGIASYSWAGEKFAGNDGGWSTGLTIAIPIFSGFLTKSQVSEARANLFILTANEETLRQSVLSRCNRHS